jgi:PAS domain S-box-containing protein
LLSTIAVTATLLTVGFLVLAQYWEPGPLTLELPLIVPTLVGFSTLAALGIAFLAIGRYRVLHEPSAFWIGLSFSALGVLFFFYVLTWPGLGPEGSALISRLPGTPAWIYNLAATINGSTLFAAALLSRPRPGGRTARWWFPLLVGWLITLTLASATMVEYEELLPPLLVNGAFTPAFHAWIWAILGLYVVGAALSIHRYQVTGDRLIGHVALFQILTTFSAMAALLTTQRFDPWWYLLRLSLAGGLVVMLFALLSEYVSLYQLERTRTGELEHERSLLQSVLAQMPSGLVVAEAPSGQIVLSNNRADEILGHGAIPAENHSGYEQYGAIHPDGTPYRAEEHPLARALLQGEVVIQEEMMYQRGDGRVIRILANAGPVRNEEGAIRAAVVSFLDITGQREAEEALRELNETLERRVAERTAVAERRARQLQALAVELSGAEERERRRLARILHDHLQQLLVAVRFQIGALQRSASEQQHSAFESTGQLLDESIQVSRDLTAQMSPPVLYELGLPAALDWLGQWMEEKHGLVVHREIASNLDIPDMGLRTFAYHATRELLFNVVKHAEVNEATLELDQYGDEIRLSVQDKGSGFDPVQKAVIPGSLGLFSIRERLEYLGGTMEIKSAARGGARVTLHMPLGLMSKAIDVVSEAARIADGYEAELEAQEYLTRLPEIRIVVADDHHIIRQGLVVMLQDEPDFDVVGQAADGRQALDLAARLRPDIVLMDVTMPDMDGIEATKRIRDRAPEVQVVGLSMHVDEQVKARMHEAGAAAYLTKTGDLSELLDTLRRVASMRQN